MHFDDALRLVAELAATQHGAVTRAQAADRGMSRRQIQRIVQCGVATEPVRGVLCFTSAPRTWRQDQMVATLAGQGFHAGFRAAAYLHRLDGFVGQRPPTPEIVGPRSVRRITGIDVVQHWVEPLDPADLVVVDAIPCTGLARTVIDVSSLGDRDLAVRSVDDFERRGASLQWLGLTAERLHRPGQSGTRMVFELLARRRSGGRVPDTWFERLVERCVAIPGLPPWVRQHDVRDASGNLIGRPDLACPALLLGVEAHSRAFHFGQRAEALDQRRDNRLAAVGWHLIYVGWYDAESPAVVAETIRATALARARQLGINLPWVA
ncbi:type IV toxin-antitoxin system AbiEi family antitoxin domain-containing protein [Desertimonas flava]|uniref:type IV toxin-antitoxin system AbiEi family antitoxin domain-containing protein n=1 Tax=Desertimonas flava TaxID=2064846 RepID=UPI000E343C72|nr:type IV toxin-antitoxin system AbiEi family antitoxin domain-containing protein [Desertimonas flava]